jgi:hypothetical protein
MEPKGSFFVSPENCPLAFRWHFFNESGLPSFLRRPWCGGKTLREGSFSENRGMIGITRFETILEVHRFYEPKGVRSLPPTARFGFSGTLDWGFICGGPLRAGTGV